MSRRAVIVAGIGIALSTGAWSQSDEEGDQHGMGLLPLPHEEFAELPKTPTYRAYLPAKVDLSFLFPSPGDQGLGGSCTAWAVGYAARAYYASVAESRNIRSLANIPSPGYIYGSIIDNPRDCKSGSRIIDALHLLVTDGSLSLKEFPYHPNECQKPSERQHSSATDFRISDWLSLDFTSLDQLKGELEKGHPVIIGVKMRKSLMRLKGHQVYHVRTDEAVIGQHSLTVVGYDERLQAFKVINSWGLRWAEGGFGWIGYDAFPSEVDEAYVMRPLPPVVPEPSPAPTPKPSPAFVVRPSPPPIADFECSHVSAMRREGKTILTGFVGSDGDLVKIANQAKAAQASVEVTVRPWPQCEMLLTLEKALAEKDRPSVKITTTGRLVTKIPDAGDATESNEYLQFAVTTPPYPSFLHAAYIQADGSVVNVVQPDNVSLAPYPPSSTITLGDIKRAGPKYKVSAPYGREMLVVIAGRSPIFAAPRPEQETEREFLSALRKALIAKPDPTSLDRIVSAGFDAVVTSESSVISTQGVQP